MELRKELISKCASRFFRYFHYIDMDAVEDIVQDSLISIFKALEAKRIDSKRGIMGYATTTVCNNTTNYYIKDGRQRDRTIRGEAIWFLGKDTEEFAYWIECLEIDLRNIAIYLIEGLKQSDMARFLQIKQSEADERIEKLRELYIEFSGLSFD